MADAIKALSLTQPWAQGIILGLKHWETRSWPTRFRGHFAIHASKQFPKWACEFAESQGFVSSILPCGVVLGTAEITECRATDSLRSELSADELEWGDYSDGRYAFKIENVTVFPQPIAAKGALGFWTWKDERRG